MTSGEWTCLISFAKALLTCSERGGSEKFKMKIYVSSGIRTHPTPVHDRKVSVLDRSATRFDGDQWFNVVQDNGIQVLKKLLRDNTCQLDYGYTCI